jgi:hypothetical protein
MFYSLWRRLRKNNGGPSMQEGFPRRRNSSFRPQLEMLEDRVMPASLPGVVVPVVASGSPSGIQAAPVVPLAGTAGSGALGGLQKMGTSSAGSNNQMSVTVLENSPATVIDMGLVFEKMSGIQHEGGLQLALLGNTNAGLVTAQLSEAELTLKYAPGKCGGASIAVSATDAAGVSVEENILVSVTPRTQASAETLPPATAVVGITAPITSFT